MRGSTPPSDYLVLAPCRADPPVHGVPVEAYVGLWIGQAMDLAVYEGRVISFGLEGTADGRHKRVRVELDDEGKVRAAKGG